MKTALYKGGYKFRQKQANHAVVVDSLARILSNSIREFFGDDGLVGFSVGHKFKPSRNYDRGAVLATSQQGYRFSGSQAGYETVAQIIIRNQ